MDVDAQIAAMRAILDRRRPSRSHDAEEPPEPNFDEDGAAERASSREERWLNP
jgi:hypothetical protein